MSRWSEQFDNHQIHMTVQTLQSWLEVEVQEIDAEHEEERRRLKKVIALIKTALDRQDPELFSESLLTNLNNQLRHPQAWNQADSYSSSGNVQHIRHINDHLTSQLHLVNQIPTFSHPKETSKAIRSIEEAFDKFCVLIERTKQSFETDMSEANKNLTELQAGLVEQKADLEHLKAETDSALGAWQREFGDTQNSRAEEFSLAQIQRGEKFDETVRNIRSNSETETKEVNAKHNEQLKSSFEAYTTNAQRYIDDMKAKHMAILEIHGLVGTDGVAGGYQKTATDEHKAANAWRIIAMISLALTAIWLLVKLFTGFGETPSGGINWSELVTAGSLTMVLLAAAGYASRQSKAHRDLEQQMRWFSLEVKAIDPFLSSLEDHDQKELKKQLSERIFGKDRTANQAKRNGLDVGTYKELSESILSPVHEIIKLVGKGQ
ncbi:hypothetical protein ACFOMH_06300 [Paracoccus mangrovi]|uniref:Uncharacterized protein n=1 Tax=Paracoccus mangrovi TaxID=1715645 RepID=A0ABV7R326_9RHOB